MTGSDPAGASAGPNDGQAAFWTSGPGRAFAADHARLDAMVAAATETLIARAAPQAGEHVLDIGCGTGATVLSLADRVGPAGRVTGLDISGTMLDVARHRAALHANVDFVHADAQVHAFAPAGHDLILSRHGLMFFADPLAAFTNLHSALRPGGRMVFLTWAAPAANPWVSVPRRVAEARLGPVPADPPRSPGMFAFAERDHVCGLLAAAGFAEIGAEEIETRLGLAGDARAAADLAVTIGPAAYVMRVKGASDDDRAAIAAGLVARFRAYETPDGVRIPARMNLFAARRP